MTTLPTTSPLNTLGRSEGRALLSAHEAIIKGALEAETPVHLIVGPRGGSFAEVFRIAGGSIAQATLREQGVRVVAAPDASRALTLAQQAAQSGRGAVTLVPNALLDESMEDLALVNAEPIVRGGSMCVILEDDPRSHPATCPRRAAARLGVPALEAGSVVNLRDAIDHALLLSRAGRCVVAVVTHANVLRSADTIDLLRNRVGRVVEVLHARRRRRVRLGLTADGGGVLRAARRLELNRFLSIPSPGERVSVGFITIGPADSALMHLVNVLGLHGRVPVLNLQLIHPIDDAAIGRILSRCEHVLVLEPRPGALELDVLQVAEHMRRRGEKPANVWGRHVPPGADGRDIIIEAEDDLHPSVLARHITHLLHAIRPSVHVASQLMPDPPTTQVIPARDAHVGEGAAAVEVRRLLRDIDQWLRDGAPMEERGIAPTSLAIDGAEPSGNVPRIVVVETWKHHRFHQHGAQAIVQAARDDRPWLIIACESAGEDLADLERFARGVIPADRADRVVLETANLADLVALRDLLRESALHDRLTIIIVRDGPPARFDTSAIDAAVSETDRLGFEPRQRMIESADEICALRETFVEDEHLQISQAGSGLRTETSVEKVSDRVAAKFRLRVRPMLEEVEVTRVRPPRPRWRDASGGKLPTPQPVHGQRPLWRVHMAGVRGEAPGAVALVLGEAARIMGYQVRTVHDPSPIGAGRRSWAQLLFTRPRAEESPPEVSALVPFGEADLLLGLDACETLRAIAQQESLRVAAPEFTSAVVNIAPFINDHDFDAPNPTTDVVASAVAAVTGGHAGGHNAERRLLADFAAACRAWFHTDRVTDMAILGAAYQRGFIPVSAEAIDGGLAAIESRGFGRSCEAFELGRRLALDASLFTQRHDDEDVPLERIARRLALSMRRGVPGSAARAKQLAALMQTSLDQMPGLAETDPGRQARRDFITACHHCTVWGGLQYAETFADLVTRLYQIDRGDTGRSLTRHAVLPLAEAMLIRDPLYVAGLAASAEHRRRIRQRLHVKLARGDEIERRYLTRIDVLAFNRRVRIDLRTSDWPARIVSAIRRITPTRLRGLKRERQLRDFLLEFMRRAIVESPNDYAQWSDAMQRMHEQAIENRLRGMAMAEVRMLVGSGVESAT